MHLEWVYLRDVEFDNLFELREQAYDGSTKYMNEMTDGSKLNGMNAMKILEMMNERKEPSFILKKFPGHDHQERSLRPNIDEIIRTNMMDIYKKKGQKKSDDPKGDYAPIVEEKFEIVVKKKMTQGELKKLKKQQQKEPEQEDK